MKSVKRSVSMPESVWRGIKDKLQQRAKRTFKKVNYSEYFQERAIEDLQESGHLPAANGANSTRAKAA